MVFYLILACQLVFLFSLLFLVPESLSPRRQLAAREALAQRRVGNTSAATTRSRLARLVLHAP